MRHNMLKELLSGQMNRNPLALGIRASFSREYWRSSSERYDIFLSIIALCSPCQQPGLCNGATVDLLHCSHKVIAFLFTLWPFFLLLFISAHVTHAPLNAVHWSLFADCDVVLCCFHKESLKSACITGVLHKRWYIRAKVLWRKMRLSFCSCSRNEALVALEILCWQQSHSSVPCWSLNYTFRRWRGDAQLQKQLPVEQMGLIINITEKKYEVSAKRTGIPESIAQLANYFL